MLYKFIISILALAIICSTNAQSYDRYLSTKSVGLYFDKRTIIRKADLQLVKSKEIDKNYSYADFYEDTYTQKLYLKTSYKLLAVEDIAPLQNISAPVIQDNQIIAAVEIPTQFSSGFITRNHSSPGFTLELPMHHLYPATMQIINKDRTNMNEERILQQLNSLGLQKSERVVTRSGGFNINYDRLFINDQDKDKFLVIWLNNDKVYANFLSNQGDWQLPIPQIIHKDISCSDKGGPIIYRDTTGTTDKSTLITELNSIKAGDKYYIGYSVATWESGNCFNSNVATCHVSLLNSGLQVERTVQIPSSYRSEEDRIFMQDFQMKIYNNNDTICAVIQSPNTGQDKLFVQCFDKSLMPTSSLKYISYNTNTYPNLIPVVNVPGGFLISYKEKRKVSTDIYTLFMSNKGYPLAPASVFSIPQNSSTLIRSFYIMRNEKEEVHYYFIESDRQTGKCYLSQYKIKTGDYFKALFYKPDETNWKQDKDVAAIEKLTHAINKDITTKKLVEFTKTGDDPKTKSVFVSKDFTIMKYSVLYKSADYTITRDLYYDSTKTLRKAVIDIKAFPGRKNETPGIINVYFDIDGNKFFEVKETPDGKTIINENEIRSDRYFYNKDLTNPYNDFHSGR